MADKLRPMSARTGIKKGGPGSEVPSTAGPSVGVGGAAALKTGGVRGLQMRTTGGKLAPGSIKTAMGNARKSTVPGTVFQFCVLKSVLEVIGNQLF